MMSTLTIAYPVRTGPGGGYLERLTGIKPPSNVQAHHVFPLKYQKDFRDLGINVNDPRFGAWWAREPHQSASRAINDAWGKFFDLGGNRQEALRLAREQAQKHGFKVNF